MTSCSRGVSESVAPANRLAEVLLVEPIAPQGESLVDPFHQLLVPERFLHKVVGPEVHGLHGHVDVAVTGHEDDRQLATELGKLLLNLHSAGARHSDIEHDAALQPG